MSKKSVQITSGLVPELSKGHCRIIFIAQTDKIAWDLLDSTFLRAVFQKNPYDLQNVRMGRKTMRCSSDLFKTVDLTGLPRSPIRFDKDRLAEFFEVEQIAFNELSEEWKVGKARIENRSYTWIKRELGIHPETAKRHVRKLLKAYLEGQTFKVVNK